MKCLSSLFPFHLSSATVPTLINASDFLSNMAPSSCVFAKNKRRDTGWLYSFMPSILATRMLWRMLRSSMISSLPPGMA